MSSTLTLTPGEKQARRYATRLALIATLGPFFYGFEGMVLNAAIKAVGTTFELGPILQGVAGAAGVIGGLIGALAAGRISDKIGRKTPSCGSAPSSSSRPSSARSLPSWAASATHSCS